MTNDERIKTVSELSRNISKQVSQGPREWKAFLTAASRFYKYSFDEQLLIYAQRPDATACATIGIWNKKMNRWVNAGTKGIALLERGSSRTSIKYVFDVSDTHPGKGGIEPQIWQLREEYRPAVARELEKTYGVPVSENYGEYLMAIAGRAVEESSGGYVDDLLREKGDGLLSDLDDQGINVAFRNTLTASVQYLMLSRCGLNPDDYLSDDDLREIYNFSDLTVLSYVGYALDKVTQPILRQIERTVKNLDRKNSLQALEKQNTVGYNEFNDLKRERDVLHDRSHIQESRGLSDSGSRTGRGAGGDAREIRDAARNVFEGSPGRDIYVDAAQREASGTPSGDRSDGFGEGKADRQTDVYAAGRDGAAEREGSDALGTRNEQHPGSSAGDHHGRADIQLSLFPTVEEQIEQIALAEDEKSSAFSVTQSDAVTVLQGGSGFENGRFRIIEQYEKHMGTKANIAFLKNEYGIGGGTFTFPDGARGYTWHDAKGIGINKNGFSTSNPDMLLTWPNVEKQLKTLILAEKYLTPVEQIRYDEWKRSRQPAVAPEGQQIAAETVDGQLTIRAGDPAAPEWVKATGDVTLTREGDTVTIAPAGGKNENASYVEFDITLPDEEVPTPADVKEYDALKGEYPGALIACQTGEHYMLFGEDAEQAAKILKSKLLSCELPGHGKVPVTGFSADMWVHYSHRLWETGRDVVLSGKDSRDAQHEITKVLMASDYIPIGTEIEDAGRRYVVESVDFAGDKVSLRDVSFQKAIGFPINRVASVFFVRETIEDMRRHGAYDFVDAEKVTDQKIDAALQEWNGDASSKTAVARYLREHNGDPKAADYLKEEYGDNLPAFPAAGTGEDISWEDARLRIEQLIADGRFLTQEERIESITSYRTKGKIVYHVGDQFKALISAGVQMSIEGVLPSSVTCKIPDSPEQEPFSLDRADFENYLDNGSYILVHKDRSEGLIKPTRPAAVNFRITDDHLGAGGQKTKFGYNLAVIRALKTIEAERRLATPEEQEILSKYVGWGGIPQAFDPDNASWAKEYTELKELLGSEEYTQARASTLNAHYTSPTVIRAMYETLERMGFKTGNILEPACGVGNFFGLLPESMGHSRLYGVELDSITGRIAKQLYQKADVTVAGFETTDRRDFFDLAVGNVPFGNYKVSDRPYDKLGFPIHDYFFAKTLDQVRPGGLIAFITSKGTMDKQSPEVRRYIAQRAELLGAVRLPNDAFQANAGTEVTSDILFLQKRDRLVDADPDWIHLGQTSDGLPINQYFAEHPDMILGTMALDERMYRNGRDTTCQPVPGADLAEQLHEAMQNITLPDRQALEAGDLLNASADDGDEALERESIPADPSVHNFSYALVNDQLYFRENSRMDPVDVPKTTEERIRGMIGLRDCTRKLISLQLDSASDEAIRLEQGRLNLLYDRYTEKYGLLNSTGNSRAFEQDSSYSLLASLEVLDDEGQLKRKADMFTKRTVRPEHTITSVGTAAEALAVSLTEKARVDLEYMASLLPSGDPDSIIRNLRDVIFKDPSDRQKGPYEGWKPADEYLSGDVRAKLREAISAAESDPSYEDNVKALQKVQPKDLDASEIDVRLGASWIDQKYIDQFMYETFQTPPALRHIIGTQYSDVTGAWFIQGKNSDRMDNVLTHVTYGTSRRSAYGILEDTLNLRDVRIFDVKEDADGKEHRVLNGKETAIAQQKQEAIRQAFGDWIWKDRTRREDLCAKYNRLFNNIRPREYDGSHLSFPGMNPEITLRTHQRNAVTRVLYGGNTLLAHCVGAGKTYTMAAAAMESKRIGLAHKSLFVVPNHLTEQWGSEFLQLYPGANILVATKKDFEPANRKKFCARIATGDYDAVIIGHSQFEKIPVSKERQERMIHQQIEEIAEGIEQAKADKSERYTIKQMEKTKKGLEVRLGKLNDDSRKDDVVTFEELGVDRLFVDEADTYKNLFLYTKMRNVAGIGQSEAQKSSDMFMKCRYMDELTDSHGVTFATGTPISNSMTELYTMMRYLQHDMLERNGLKQFDSWAADFGETITAIELAPEGTGFRAKTRFARFFNLPELMSMWKEATDIQTADMLKLPVPIADHRNIVCRPSDFQKEMVKGLGKRAEAVRRREVEPYEDNMLAITNDGRKLALDQRLINSMLPDDPDSKIGACVGNILQVWTDTAEKQGTQLVFCDLSTPHYDGNWNAYDEVKNKLIERGVPSEEIAFIHDAKTEVQKASLFAAVRAGKVRVLIGSTQTMGAGTNVQERVAALHHLDCPWRPRDIEQREGRAIRQGNIFDTVPIFRYVTKGTFDAYNWSLIENKQKFIAQVMTGRSPARSCEDIDETVLSFAEVKALATGDPRIKEKMDLDIQVAKLAVLKAAHNAQRYRMEDNLAKHYPKQLKETEEAISRLQADQECLEKHPQSEKSFSMTVLAETFEERKIAGAALINACKMVGRPEEEVKIGEYRGFDMNLVFDDFQKVFKVVLKNQLRYVAEVGEDPVGNIARLNNALDVIPKRILSEKEVLGSIYEQIEFAKKEVSKEFQQEKDMKEKTARLNELNVLLNKTDSGQDETKTDSAKEQSPGERAGSDLQGEKENAAAHLSDRIDQLLHRYAASVAGNEPEKGEEKSITRGR